MPERSPRSISRPASIVLLLLLAGCATIRLEPPEVNLLNLRVQEVTLSHVNMLADLRLHNPNNREIMIRRVEYELELNGIRVMHGRALPELRIEGATSGVLQLRIASAYWNLVQLFRNMQKTSEVNFVLSGTIRAGSGPVTFTYPFWETGTVPLNRPIP